MVRRSIIAPILFFYVVGCVWLISGLLFHDLVNALVSLIYWFGCLAFLKLGWDEYKIRRSWEVDKRTHDL